MMQRLLKRYWSLIFAMMLVVLGGYFRRIPFDPLEFEDSARAIWILCLIEITVLALYMGLIVHSWRTQRRFAVNKWRLVFWTHLLLFPALCAVVLGLGEIQRSTYEIAMEQEQFQSLHRYAGDVKGLLIWAVLLDAVLMVVWAIVAVIKNESSRPDSKPA
jgi:hypothetical protein